MNWTLFLIVKILIALVLMLLNVLFLIWWERKILGHIHCRFGPMRVGWHGWAQSLADAMKVMFKEDIVPANASKFVFWMAPMIVFVPAFIVYICIPVAPGVIVADLDLGLLFAFSIASIMPIGFNMAGWASYNKYSLLGGLRAAAQQISYEVSLLLNALGAIMLAGSLNFTKIVEAQSPLPFIVYQPVGFLLFFLATLAELNRTPFDMPEAESELVSGYNIEYSGPKFALFMLSEYASLFFMSGLTAVLYLGGWRGPLLPPVISFFLKTYLVVFLIFWMRGTVPRLRVDQLMENSWKVLIPMGLVNIMLTGLYMVGLISFVSLALLNFALMIILTRVWGRV